MSSCRPFAFYKVSLCPFTPPELTSCTNCQRKWCHWAGLRELLAMLLLIGNDGPLGPEWLDHPLGGDWAGHRECHIGGDFLLAYKLDDNVKPGLVVFVRAGTHAELFE